MITFIHIIKSKPYWKELLELTRHKDKVRINHIIVNMYQKIV
jgi:hypothetical protein